VTEHDTQTDRQRALEELRRELEAMGEPAATDAELEVLLGHASDHGYEPEPVAFVGRLVDISHAEAATLDEVSARRSWAAVESRTVRSVPAEATVEPREGAGRGWVPVLVGLVAVAAAVGLAIIVLPNDTEPTGAGGEVAGREPTPAVDPEQLEALSAQARAGLLAVGVDDTSASRRARKMRAQYREALGVEPGADPEEGAG